MNAIQTNSQHLLRYLAAAVIVNKRRRNVMKDLVKIIEQESYEYRDPITGASCAHLPVATYVTFLAQIPSPTKVKSRPFPS